MRIRRRRSPLLLLPLLLPHLAAAIAVPDAAPGNAKAGSVEQLASSPDVSGPAAVLANSKPDPGTKDAPVDGLDGKPKLGPFVDGSSAGKKKPQLVEDLATSTTKPTTNKPVVKEPDAAVGDAGATPKEKEQHRMLMEAQANIMDDPNRIAPKEGTTGTEGGISEKERLKKASEAKKDPGAKPELKKPETPKEAPPLPESEEPSIGKEKTKKLGKEDDKVVGAQGMEVWVMFYS
jgi:Ca2+/H+ antiporter, TMEM165/GDT1 family